MNAAAVVRGEPKTAPRSPSAWGSPPTPLLPRWYLEKRGSQRLTRPLLEALDLPPTGGPIRAARDLDRFWEQRSTPIGAEARQGLLALVDEIGNPPLTQVVLAAGTSLADLLSLPLDPRTRNCLLRAFGYGRLEEGRPVTVGQLQNLPDFGAAVLVDLMCLTETEPAASAPPAPQPGPVSASPLPLSAPGQLPLPPESDAPTVDPPPPAAWGSPSTPLLPRWYRKNMADTPLPLALIPHAARPADAMPRLRTVGDLPGFWNHRSRPLDNGLLRSVSDLVQNRWPPNDYTVLPAGVPRSRLFQCPFRVRTTNCVQRAYNMNQLTEDAPTTVGDLLVLPNFGIASLIDYMSVVEAGLESRFLSTFDASSSHAPGDQTAVPSLPDPVPVLCVHSIAGLALERVFAAAQEFRGARTLGDALKGDLSTLAAAIGVAGELDEIPIEEVVLGHSLAEQLVLAIADLRDSLQQSDAKKLILETRILADDPQTLVQIANRVGLSRERIRQLERAIKATIKSELRPMIGTISALLAERLAPVTPAEALEEQMDAVLSTAAIPDAPEGDLTAARRLVRRALAYSCVDGVCLSSEAVKVAEGLRKAARASADDAGLVDEARLRSTLPDESWEQHWDNLTDRSDLRRLNGHLALRATAKAKAKAALLQVGRPATKEEVAEVSGLAPDRVGAQMSVLPSIVRADKLRWGLAEWVDDEYEGIPAEIVQRINEDGGSTRLDRLLDEIPRRFGVSESSVRAYVETPAFRVEHGWVSVADNAAVTVGRFEDVSSGCDGNGDPYWMFPVHERYLQGFSITGVPPELVAALGCRLGGSTTTTVRAPAGVRDVSVIWRTTSLRGPEIGRIADALTAIDARDGDPVCIVVHSCDEISFVPFETLRSLRGLSPDNLQRAAQPSTDESGPRLEGGTSMGVRVAGTVRGKIHGTDHDPAGNVVHSVNSGGSGSSPTMRRL